jgi:hypothetical protein
MIDCYFHIALPLGMIRYKLYMQLDDPMLLKFSSITVSICGPPRPSQPVILSRAECVHL